ncbi:MAG: hypothetical protein ACR2RB_17120 [Gammaproteobacteria bacterium]
MKAARHIFFVLLFMALNAQAAVLRFETVQPRAVGYMIGDLVRQEIRLELETPWQLDMASLPAAGRIDRWLELREPQARANGSLNSTRYVLALTYQVFNAPQTVEYIFLPQKELYFTDGEKRLPLFVPARPLSVASMVAADDVEYGHFPMQPDRRPRAISLGAPIWWSVLGLIGIAAGLAYLAYAYLTLPFFARSKAPFARAYKSLRRLTHTPDDGQRHRRALQHVHRAFDRTAGKVVFAGEVDKFLESHPRFAGQREEIENFYSRSRAYFFENNEMPAGGTELSALLALCLACRDIERGLA